MADGLAKWMAQFEGPFFSKDPVLTYNLNVRGFISDAIRDAERVTRAKAPYRGKHPSGALLDHLWARPHGLSGKPWYYTAVVSSWGLGEGVYPTGRFGGWFNYAGKAERRRHFMAAGRTELRHTKRMNRDFLKGLNP